MQALEILPWFLQINLLLTWLFSKYDTSVAVEAFHCSSMYSKSIKGVFHIQLINNGLIEMKHVLEFQMLNNGFLCSPNTCQLNCEWSYNSQILLVYSCHWVHLLKSHLSVMSLFTGQEALCWTLHYHCLPRVEERGRVTSLHELATLCYQPPAVGYLDRSNASVMVILVWAQGTPGPSVSKLLCS